MSHILDLVHFEDYSSLRYFFGVYFLLFFFSLCHILCYVILCYRYVNLSETYYEYFVSTIILVTCAL